MSFTKKGIKPANKSEDSKLLEKISEIRGNKENVPMSIRRYRQNHPRPFSGYNGK